MIVKPEIQSFFGGRCHAPVCSNSICMVVISIKYLMYSFISLFVFKQSSSESFLTPTKQPSTRLIFLFPEASKLRHTVSETRRASRKARRQRPEPSQIGFNLTLVEKNGFLLLEQSPVGSYT